MPRCSECTQIVWEEPFVKSPRLAAVAILCLGASGAFSQSLTDQLLALTPPPADMVEGQFFTLEPSTGGQSASVVITAEEPGSITWPVIDGDPAIEAWILPLSEGHYVPADDVEWIENLVDHSPHDTTASLSMPWIALDLEGATLTYIFENPFDNEITFEEQDGRLAARVTHEFKDNWDELEFPVTVVVGEDDPIAPARIYRQWLMDRGEFVTMAEKIEATPNAERLLGAAQIYLFGNQALAREDIPRREWPEFCRRLASAEEGSIGHRIFASLSEEARQQVLDLPSAEWADNYMTGQIVHGISEALQRTDLWVGVDLTGLLASEEDREVGMLLFADAIESVMVSNARRANCLIFQAEFSDFLDDPTTWGDGYSVGMLDAFAEAGLDRLLLVLDGWEGTEFRPNVAEHAEELGYLMGTYDSYHSMHRPDAGPDSTWSTAQFGWEAWESLGVMRADGTFGTGFRGQGRHVSPLVAMPLVEERVDGILGIVPFNAWFVDCDAFGEFFDDYHPDHRANQRQDMEARLERLAWFAEERGLVVGSEGGSAYAASVIHYAHGMMTPCFGWGDERMRDRDSEYYLGAYYPPDGPHVFMDQVPLAPGYEKFNYDPRFRLPLYQAVFNDSVMATHSWGYHSLKFTDQVVTNALMEMLYQVAPIYVMNLREFPRHRDRMVATHEFFSPLQRETGLMPMTDFEWLTDDRLVQRTVYGDEIALVANFSEGAFELEGTEIPARSVMSERLDSGEVQIFTPAEP
jgi:Glycosyl hydrolases related to GH101 family, GH129